MPPNASDANMQTVAQVEFYWPTYNPVEAFDFFEQTPVENVILREGVQIDYPGNTTGAVYEWMRVNELHVFATKLIRSAASAVGTAATASRSPADPTRRAAKLNNSSARATHNRTHTPGGCHR